MAVGDWCIRCIGFEGHIAQKYCGLSDYIFESVKVQNSTDDKRKFRVGFFILQIYINFS